MAIGDWCTESSGQKSAIINSRDVEIEIEAGWRKWPAIGIPGLSSAPMQCRSMMH